MTKINHDDDPSEDGMTYPGKRAKTSGWGHDFEHASPQRRVRLMFGDVLVPATADQLPVVPPGHVDTVERAILMIAGMLADRDFGIFLGISPEGREAKERRCDADVLRRLAGGELRQFLGTDVQCPSGKIFAGVTERGRRARSDTLLGAVYGLLAYHRHGEALRAGDMFIARIRDEGCADSWRVYESRVAHLDDPGDERWWATVELADREAAE